MKRSGASKKVLVGRLLAIEPLKEPFRLCEWIFVNDPLKFHAAIVADVRMGPKGPRALTGALFSEIEMYLQAIEQSVKKNPRS
jgi:hypothetical protein